MTDAFCSLKIVKIIILLLQNYNFKYCCNFNEYLRLYKRNQQLSRSIEVKLFAMKFFWCVLVVVVGVVNGGKLNIICTQFRSSSILMHFTF